MDGNRASRGGHFKELLLFVSLLIVLVVVCDFGVRACFPVPTRGYGVWAGVPGSMLVCESEPDGFAIEHRYNRYGFRGGDFPEEPVSDVRVVCIGDSFTEGIGVEEDEAWPSVLSRLAEKDQWEVLNLGDSGSQPDRYALITARVAVPLKPTDCVLCIIPPDLRDGPTLPLNIEVRERLADPFRENRRKVLKPVASVLPGWLYLVDRARGRYRPQTGSIWAPYDEAAIKEEAATEIAQREHMSVHKARATVAERWEDVAQETLEAGQRRAYNWGMIRAELIEPFLLYRQTTEGFPISADDLQASTEAWLQWYADTCRQSSIRPWVLYFPTPPLVSRGYYGAFTDPHYAAAPDILRDRSVAALLAESCEKCGVAFIDATEPLLAHNDETLFYRWDTHPTPPAHRLVAEAVYKKMCPVVSASRAAGQ